LYKTFHTIIKIGNQHIENLFIKQLKNVMMQLLIINRQLNCFDFPAASYKLAEKAFAKESTYLFRLGAIYLA